MGLPTSGLSHQGMAGGAVDLATLKYERETLSLALKRWDDLLSPKERVSHPARQRLAQRIAELDEQLRTAAREPTREAA
jgi:hypothetical protein